MARLLNLTVAIAVVAMLAQPALAADPVAGGRVFKAQCAVCHSSTAGGASGVGPSLAGVVGRKAGTQAAYLTRYSSAMKRSGKIWTPANLNLYITTPARAVPGNQMPFTGLGDAAQRNNLVAYLATLH